MRHWMLVHLGLFAACTSVVPTSEAGAGSGTGGTASGETTQGPGDGVTSGDPSLPTMSTVGGDPTMTDPGVFDVPIDSTTGGPPLPEMLCLPPELHGDPVQTHPSGWTAFEGCAGDDFILHTFGESPLVSEAEVEGLFEQYEQSMLGFPGALGVGQGECCEGADERCLSVLVEAWNFDFGEALAYANELFAGVDGGCLGVRVLLVGDLGPRCEESDPDCGPLYCNEPPPYDPGAPRFPVETEESEGICTHDGDCYISNQRCIDFNTPPSKKGPFGGNCAGIDDPLYCGCVEDECRWYEQG